MSDFITRPPTDLATVRPGYSPVAALACGELAATVYSSLQGWSDACARGGWYSYLVDHAEVQVGICASTSAIVVAARGSSELADWRDDLHIFPLTWPPLVEAPGRVCRGFRAQGRRVIPDICQLVSTARRAFPAAPLYITGHSLGAALCPFLALGLEAAGFTVAAIYAHEMPRAFTRAGAEWYDARLGSRTFRVVVVNRGEQDLVTRVAPSRLGFWHVGVPEIIVDGIRYESAAKWEEVRRAHPVSWWTTWRILERAAWSVEAHLSSHLLAALRADLERTGGP